MGAATGRRDPQNMAATTTATEIAPVDPTDRSRTLAFLAPLLLFVHGILSWVDSLDSQAGQGWVAVLSALFLAAAVAGLAFLTADLGEQTGRGALASVAVVMVAFGAGATATLALGRVSGLLDDTLPAPLSVGGPLLLGAGLALLFFRLALVGRVSLGYAFVAALGAAAIAIPWGLVPLGALILLIGFGPLTQAQGESAVGC